MSACASGMGALHFREEMLRPTGVRKSQNLSPRICTDDMDKDRQRQPQITRSADTAPGGKEKLRDARGLLPIVSCSGAEIYRAGALACCRDWISMYTLISDTAAGVTPGMRLAWPRVWGRTRIIFSFISRDKPETLL